MQATVRPEFGAEMFEGGQQFRRNRFPGKVPYHRPQFVFLVETQSMVDGVEMTGAFFEDDVAAFAVGVVDEGVKERDRAQAVLSASRKLK